MVQRLRAHSEPSSRSHVSESLLVSLMEMRIHSMAHRSAASFHLRKVTWSWHLQSQHSAS